MTPLPLAHPNAGTRVTTVSGAQINLRAWLGEGSFARVYQGSAGGRLCALKFARPEITEASERLEAERKILSAVSSPHLVALQDYGTWGDVPFLVLEWLDGTTIADLLADRPRLAVRQALEIAEGVLAGLAALHTRGLAHGDVRPQNVMVVPARGAVLLDPGAATAGRWPDEVPVSPSSDDDVRAAGALLHLLLTGKTPVPGAVRLGPRSGFNPRILRLWEMTAAAPPASAADALEALRGIQRTL